MFDFCCDCLQLLKHLEKFEPLGLKMKHYEAASKTHIQTNDIIDYLVANIETLLTSQVISNLKVRARVAAHQSGHLQPEGECTSRCLPVRSSST